MSAAASVMDTTDYIVNRIVERLSGLTDEEFMWEPVDGCWSVRLDDGVPAMDRSGSASLTTIAWRIAHIGGECLAGFTQMRFPDHATEVAIPVAAADAGEFLVSTARAWRAGLASVPEDEWTMPLGESWGPHGESSTLDLALHVIDEVAHHGGEVGLMRDLYAVRVGWA